MLYHLWIVKRRLMEASFFLFLFTQFMMIKETFVGPSILFSSCLLLLSKKKLGQTNIVKRKRAKLNFHTHLIIVIERILVKKKKLLKKSNIFFELSIDIFVLLLRKNHIKWLILQWNSVVTDSSGQVIFVHYNRSSV